MPALCELLSIGDYQATVELALERWRPISETAPTVEGFARMLDLEPDAVSEVFSHVGAPIAATARLVAPVVAYYAGSEAGHALLRRIATIADEPALVAAIADVAPEAPDAMAIVASAAQCASVADLRALLELDYRRFNGALQDLGSPYSPIHNPTGHAQAVEHFVQTGREQIMGTLRSRFLSAFQAHAPLDEYVLLRDLRSIAPDPAWLDEYDIPPDDVIAAHVAAWVEHHGEDPAADMTPVPLADLRKQNQETVAGAFSEAKPLIEAWVGKRETAAPAAWTKDSAVHDLVEAAHASGIFDFDPLSVPDAMGWLLRHGHWPAGMPLSLEPSTLGLTAADLVSARDTEGDKRRERTRQLGIVTLDGTEFDATRDGYAAIVQHVNATLREDLLRVGMSPASLAPMPAPPPGPGRPGGGGGKPVRPDRLSKDQTAAIGLVGETVAYAWLSRRYPAECSPAAWKSAYCETIGEPPGDDTLGYDFAIALKTRTVYFEVKATSGTDASVELSEREVGVARDCVRSSRYQYRVLFVTEALDAERRALFVLPNPMDPANQAFFRFPGSGLTCTFKLDQ